MRNIGWPVAVMAIALSGCAGIGSSKESEQQVAAFHKQLDAGNYAAIYQASGTDLKTATSEQDFTRLLTAVHTKLGNVKTAELVQTNIISGTGGSTATLTYQTKFERGTGTEIFVYAGAKPVPVLIEYTIQSNDMLVN